MDDDINRGLPSDRLLAEWPVATAAPPTSAPGSAQRWILPAEACGHVFPGALDRSPLHGAAGLVAVPADIDALWRNDPDLPQRWRLALRTALQAAFAAGLVAVDVDRDVAPGVSAYVLERPA